MKIALGFWGITRSLRHTLPSIQAKVFDVLTRAGIEYTVFLHTYCVPSSYSNVRTGESGIRLDNDEYKLLRADVVQVEDQDVVKGTLNLPSYRTHPDPWNTGYNSVDNFICAMYSKLKLTEMIERWESEFDTVVFLRPDVEYLTEFDPAWLSFADDKTICVPNFHLVLGMNDRFAITTRKTYTLYGTIFHQMLPYSKRAPLHSETVYAQCMRAYGIAVRVLPFYFDRIRADGSRCVLDADRRPFR
jgi:hypothetical protein